MNNKDNNFGYQSYDGKQQQLLDQQQQWIQQQQFLEQQRQTIQAAGPYGQERNQAQFMQQQQVH
jgi:hypothetical protein